MPLILIASERFADHQTPPGHPESPERAEVMDVVAGRWRRQGGLVVAPREATREQLARVHDAGYLRRIAETAGSAVALDPDTYTSPETPEVALLAAGAAVDAVERVMGAPAGAEPGRGAIAGGTRAFALIRPPGHHAERAQAMGFCVYNNVAVAAAHARTLGAGRIAIVDYDVHHGNGTQHLFESDPEVLYVSMHQFPFYPGTGDANEIGRGPGQGFTVNVPLEAGAVDEDYQLVFAEVVGPVVRQFRPDIVLLSAGFDAHERDPLGGMRLSTEAFTAMTWELRQIAAECCGGRIAAVTEGGYDLPALRESLEGVIAALASDGTTDGDARWPASGIASSRGRVGAAVARGALARFWKFA
jgi:acetoin utilization deacetylase AcuC-like enzyme